MNRAWQRRRLLASLLALPITAVSAPARGAASVGAASDVRPPYRVFMILYRGETEVEQGFRDYLRDHHVPVDITVRDIDHDLSRLAGVIAEAKAARPDLVYTWGTGITVSVLGEFDQASPLANITDIPVLFTMVASPTGSRVLAAAGPSGRNFTGVSHIAPLDSQIRAMRAYRTVTRLAVIYNPTESNSELSVRELGRLCKTERIELVVEPVPLDPAGRPRADALPALVAEVATREPQFLYIGPDTFIGDNRDVLTSEASRHHLPVFTGTELEIRTSGAMVGLVTNYYALGKFAGYKAERILVDRVPAGNIPVETLGRFNYVVKMSVARALGLYPPIALLDYAEIIP